MSNEALTDALRLVPRRATPQQLEGAAFNLSAEIGAAEAMKLGPHIERAYELLVAAAPTSPLPGGGWKPSRNDVARRCDPKAWEFYDRHIDNPIMGAECRAEVAASIRMADAILALPAAPTGDGA